MSKTKAAAPGLFVVQEPVYQIPRTWLTPLRHPITLEPVNPRRYFDPVKLQGLADTFLHTGIQQAIVIRLPEGAPAPEKWTEAEHPILEIVAGERRWRASGLAGLERVPCHLRPLSLQQAVDICIIENDQREDLNALERARGYRTWLQTERGRTQEMLAEKIGRDQSHVSNYLRLLELPESVQIPIEEGHLHHTHARDHLLPVLRLPPEQAAHVFERVTRAVRIQVESNERIRGAWLADVVDAARVAAAREYDVVDMVPEREADEAGPVPGAQEEQPADASPDRDEGSPAASAVAAPAAVAGPEQTPGVAPASVSARSPLPLLQPAAASSVDAQLDDLLRLALEDGAAATGNSLDELRDAAAGGSDIELLASLGILFARMGQTHRQHPGVGEYWVDAGAGVPSAHFRPAADGVWRDYVGPDLYARVRDLLGAHATATPIPNRPAVQPTSAPAPAAAPARTPAPAPPAASAPPPPPVTSPGAQVSGGLLGAITRSLAGRAAVLSLTPIPGGKVAVTLAPRVPAKDDRPFALTEHADLLDDDQLIDAITTHFAS